MKYRTFPKLSRQVSEVGLGGWQIGAEWGPVSDETAQRLLCAAWDAGVYFFDTADIYGRGRSDRLIGRFMRDTGARPFLAEDLRQRPGAAGDGRSPAGHRLDGG